MIADGSVDEWDGEPRTTEEIIDNAHAVWVQAARDDDTMGDEWFAPTDEAIDLKPLIKRLKRDGCWADMPKGWSKAA